MPEQTRWGGWFMAALLAVSGCIAPDRTASGRPAGSAAASGGARIEAERMQRKGGNSLAGSGMIGVILYENKDALTTRHTFPAAGRWRFDIRGATSDKRPAGVAVFIDGQLAAAGWFTSKKPQVISLLADVDTAGEHEVRLGQITDVGENDAYVDWIEMVRAGDLMAAPAPPAAGAVATGHWRNLFVERGYPEAEVTAKLQRAWDKLFYGDPEQEAVYFQKGSNGDGPLAYLMDIGNGDVRSEGMSYGMMVAVQMGHKAEFDALWNWAKTYMAHPEPKHPAHGFFSWQMRPDGKVMDPNPAPDGEEYFITALCFAHARWGSGRGIYDYRAEANRLLYDVRNRADIAGRDANGRDYRLGSLWNREHKMVRFTPDTADYVVNGDHTDPSYHVPAFYEVWARVGPASEAGFWREAAKVSRDFLAKTANPITGLVPDYAEFDGRPKPRQGNPGGADFRYDAWRAAMNWSVDYAWWSADPREVERSDRLQAFFAKLGLGTYVNRYHLDGRPIGKERSLGLVSTNAVASLAGSHARAWRFVDELWGAEVPHGTWRYYDGMLYLMSMLHVSGQFRAYFPADVKP